jgi:two-component system sensor histidine kinase KdpD
MLYLLVILLLASTRGRYPAILASVVAFLSFDFFIVPPLYTFVIYRIEEWIALFVFLVQAIVTSQLADGLRTRAEQASRRERETHILYDLTRIATSEAKLEQQLHAIAQAFVDVFSSWGISDCAFLQPDQTGTMCMQASASNTEETVALSADEQTIASWVMTHGQTIGLYDNPARPSPFAAHFTQRFPMHGTDTGRMQHHSFLLLPLKMGQHMVGVLRLQVQDRARQLLREGRLELINGQPDAPKAPTAFFWTFLDQATVLIERVWLWREHLRVEILQRTDALRAALLSSVSHDLRTPLTSIKAAASSLLQEDVQWDEEARRSFASSIVREADRLNRLVGNLLDLSKIEEGALTLQKEWYPLPPLICEVLDRLQTLLRGRVVQTHLPDDIPPIALDYVQIDQVLTNLIENAVRYSPAATPIEVGIEGHGKEIRIWVADQGPGVPATERERIFDKFYRVLDKEGADAFPAGSGLGLAVCRGIVEAHGGRIWAEAREGGGALFLIALPVNAPEGTMI